MIGMKGHLLTLLFKLVNKYFKDESNGTVNNTFNKKAITAVKIQHHGAVTGVTGSCHQLHINAANSILIDCGLFQGAETSAGASASQLAISFDISTVQALIVTHCHIDHVGRIPYLLAAGFSGPIYATQATAALLPMVIEDALKVGVTRDKKIINACVLRLKTQLIALEYKQWQRLALTKVQKVALTKNQQEGGFNRPRSSFNRQGTF